MPPRDVKNIAGPTAQTKTGSTVRKGALACIEGVNKNELNEENNKQVTLKATLGKPKQKERSSRVLAWVRGTAYRPGSGSASYY